MANKEPQFTEARLFVRASDGSSLVLPPLAQEGAPQRLSFSFAAEGDLTPKDMFEKIEELKSTTEETGIEDFHLQQFLGKYGLVRQQQDRWSNQSALGYLAQIYPGKSMNGETGRQVVAIDQVDELLHAYGPERRFERIDSVDRELARKAVDGIVRIKKQLR